VDECRRFVYVLAGKEGRGGDEGEGDGEGRRDERAFWSFNTLL